jgi:hypothetical protein
MQLIGSIFSNVSMYCFTLSFNTGPMIMVCNV